MPVKADVLAYLQNSPVRTTQRLISSQIADYRDLTPDGASAEYARIHSITGKLPGMYGGVLGDFFIPEESGGVSAWPINQNQLKWHTDNAISYWNAGMLVTLSFDLANLGTGNQADYLTASPNIGAILTGSALCNPWVGGVHLSNQTIYQLLDRQLIAPLQTLANAGVVVILRPLTEQTINFWWGTGNLSVPDYITLWKLIHDYVGTKGLANSVIWCYASTPGQHTLDAYPGSAFVDLVGLDYYSADGRIPAGIAGWADLKTLNKPMAFTELGLQTYVSPQIPRDFNLAMADIETNYPDATYFMTWWNYELWSGETNLSTALARPWLGNQPLSLFPSPPPGGYVVDGVNYTRYGGYADLDFTVLGGIRKFGSAGAWGLGKIGARWVFIDPSGKIFLSRGLFKVQNGDNHNMGWAGSTHVFTDPPTADPDPNVQKTFSNNVAAKYGSITLYQNVQMQRLSKLHYNTASAYSDEAAAYAPFPFVRHRNGMYYSMTQAYASQAGMTEVPHWLMQCLNPSAPNYGNGYGARVWVDALDPKYHQWMVNSTGSGSDWGGPNLAVNWYMGVDGDWAAIFFGAGVPNEVNGMVAMGGAFWPHAGMLALWCKPNVTVALAPDGSTSTWSVDTVVYAKKVLIDDLKAKYQTIAALNTAWGTGGYYTTFDSDAGGWGVGTGLADEDGRRPRSWFGDAAPVTNWHDVAGSNEAYDSTTWGLAGTTITSSFGSGTVSQLREDLDLNLYKQTKAYLLGEADRIHRFVPDALYGGPTGATGQNAPPRRPAFKAAGEVCQLLGCAQPSDRSNTVACHAYTAEALGVDIPWYVTLYNPCTGDSDLFWEPGADSRTQVERGTAEGAIVDGTMSYEHTTGVAVGTFPIVAIHRWDFKPDLAEGLGWGIQSYQDNFFDGRDYRASIPDPYTPGVMTLREDQNHLYGDTITPIKAAFKRQFTTLQSELLTPAVPVALFTVQVTTGTRTVVCTDQSTNAPTSWAWTFGDAGTSTAQNPSHTYAADGSYVISLTATNVVGSSAPVTHSVTIALAVSTSAIVAGGYLCTF